MSHFPISPDIADAVIHNMSAPPKSVVSFEGLVVPSQLQQPPGERPQLGTFGVPVCFSLPETWRSLSLQELLREVDPKCRARTQSQQESRLASLLAARAYALPLPDGCLVISRQEHHAALWPDALSALAVLAKCTDTVWLRDKEPSWQAALARIAVSLLVPPAFAERLPKPEQENP